MKRIIIVWILGVLVSSCLLSFSSIALWGADTWTERADMPDTRCYLSTSVVKDRIYAIGGKTGGWAAAVSFSTVEEYSPATDTWARKAEMPTPRAYFSTSAVEGKIYAIGGATGPNSSLSTVGEYDTGFLPRKVEAKGKLATAWGKIKTR